MVQSTAVHAPKAKTKTRKTEGGTKTEASINNARTGGDRALGLSMSAQFMQAKALSSMAQVAEPPVPRNIGVSAKYKLGPTLSQAKKGPQALNKGEGGSGVFELQKLLQSAGFEVEADGKFGGNTETAVREFQKKYGLKPDGKAGPNTIKTLQRNTAAGGAAQPGDLSPDSAKYTGTAPVADSKKIHNADGSLDSSAVLSQLTQYDKNSGTKLDSTRCGTTTAIAASIATGGQEGLEKFADKISGYLDDIQEPEAASEARAILKKIKDKSATFGDIGQLSELTAKAFGTSEAGGEGILFQDLLEMFDEIGISRKVPSNGTIPSFSAGEVMPSLVDLDGDGNGDHFVLFGADKDGNKFVYDPMPKDSGKQLMSPTDASYAAYAANTAQFL